MWLLNLLKRSMCSHNWERYDELIEQIFTGGHYAWQKCSKCKNIKFDSADRNTPQQSGWKEHKDEVERIMKTQS